ncbi:dihydrolipoyl dehydrogenase [Microvirga sp. W0021]|uniref:Dihydrolipoyl dehydrogenase n=1 Tax=Hohaiivirga grylli TaxID=3133970 RepID=A0ABV0BKW7_9HYPH
MSDTYDIIVIGAGPGGYVAAIRAAQLGFKVAVVDRQHLGGICLNWGCIPTKALLRSAEIYNYMHEAKNFGLSVKDANFDIKAIIERSRGVAKRLNGGVELLLRKNKVDVIWGEASIESVGVVKVSPSDRAAPPKGALGVGTYKTKNIIIATGARPRVLPGLEPDKNLIWTYYEAMVPEKLPKSLIVMGSGAIGIEFASFYNTMGTEVTVVEVLPQILPVEDAEIAAFARKAYEKQGLRIMTRAKVVSVQKGADSITATIEEANGTTRQITAEKLISAVGVVPNTENLGLEKLGVTVERGIIKTDGRGATNVPGIYAIGDVAGAPMLAHKAEHEGVICVETIKGMETEPMDRNKIPGCTYSSPQIASVGLTEAKAMEAGYDIRVGRFPFLGNGKAIALGEPEGLVKTIFDRQTGALLGAHMVGAEVTELIQGFIVAMSLEATEEDLMHIIFPHPTLSEMMHESVMDAYGRVIHM